MDENVHYLIHDPQRCIWYNIHYRIWESSLSCWVQKDLLRGRHATINIKLLDLPKHSGQAAISIEAIPCWFSCFTILLPLPHLQLWVMAMACLFGAKISSWHFDSLQLCYAILAKKKKKKAVCPLFGPASAYIESSLTGSIENSPSKPILQKKKRSILLE